MTPSSSPSDVFRKVQIALLSAVVVLLAAILVVLVVDPSGDDGASVADDDSSDSDAAIGEPAERVASRFIGLIYDQRAVEKAESLMCDDYVGQSPEDLLDDLTDWEADSDLHAETTTYVDEETTAKSTDFVHVLVDIEAESYENQWGFQVRVRADGDDSCVSEVR